MRHFGFLSVLATTVVGGIIVLGCSQRVTTYLENEGGLPTGTSSGASGKTSSGSNGTSGTSSGSSGTSSGSSGTSSGSSGTSSGSSGTSSGGSGTCPSSTPIDATLLPWKAPKQAAGACTAAQVNAFVSYVDNNNAATYADWKTNGVTDPTCRACIFGKESDAQWAPLLEDGAGELVGLNVGGCIAIASGNTACGKAYQNWFDCRFEACADCPAGASSQLQTCLAAASQAGNACKPAFDAVGTICTDPVIADAETACDGTLFVFEGPVKAQCVGGVP